MPIDINSTFQPRNDGDFPVNEARFIQAAALTVADLTARDDLLAKPGRLEVGQLAWVVSEGKLYSLDAGKASWTEVTLGNPNAVTTDSSDQFDSATGGEETAPAVGDRFLLESLANSLQKRWIQLQNIIVSKLRTTGAAVNIGSAAPPTLGQVLTATGATAATWQDPAGGGGASTTINTTIRTTSFTPLANEINLLDPSGGAFAVTVPAASTFNNGDVLGFKYSVASAQTVTLNRSGSDTIEGFTSYTMNQPRGALIFKSDGVDKWWAV